MKLRIGSRGSRLAVAQAEWIGRLLQEKNPGLAVDYVRITTTGDRDATSSLTAIGGKGVFVKEIEEALARQDIDLAIHSLKDVPQELAAGLILGPFPPREDPRDALVSRFGEHLAELPKGSTIATSSPRRRAQILHRYGKRGYKVVPVRGNVDTRLRKVRDGEFDAVVLAAAGLRRIGLEAEITQILGDDEMLPAPGQGCLGLELRESDGVTFRLLESIRDDAADKTARAERAFLLGLGGNCLVPVGATATLQGKDIVMRALLLDPDGREAASAAQSGPADAPDYVGARLAGQLLIDGGSDLMFRMEGAPRPSGE